MKSPFPYFGGKYRVAHEVWQRFGDVSGYIEPFFGSGAVLLGRPQPYKGLETINDKDHFLANFWRALQAEPEKLAELCDWPINETDLHARHVWLMSEGSKRIEACYGDPDHYDLKVAAWWVWGLCQWIGSGWCAGRREGIENQMPTDSRLPQRHPHNEGGTVQTKRPSLWPHKQIGGVFEARVVEQKPLLLTTNGIHTKRPRLTGRAETGVHAGEFIPWFEQLAGRMRSVRVCCGDWKRVMGAARAANGKPVGIFLDPPYTSKADRTKDLYNQDSLDVGQEAYIWCREHEDDLSLRIALCGYEGEYDFPETWSKFVWKASEGYARGKNQKGRDNAKKERIWFSPGCLKQRQEVLL